MAKPTIITGLDIGTSSIKMLVASKRNGELNLEVIWQGKEPSFGVRRGVIIDIEKTAKILQSLLLRVRAETGQKIDSVHVNIGGSHIFTTYSHGTVAVSRADKKVSKEDVERVIQAAQTFSLPSNNEILDIFPKEFAVDGQSRIKEVVGMQGVRLETEVLVLAGFSPYKNNLTQTVLSSDLQILDIVPSPLASSLAVLTPRQQEIGVALLDIGAGTTELSVFEDGDLVHLAIFPIGSSNITNDIAIGLKTDIDTAERIKIERGCCVFKGKDKKERIETETEGEEDLILSQKTLTKIITARVEEIFEEVKKELKKIQKYELLPAGIVLTGGGSKLPKIVEFAQKDLKLHCRIGKPYNFTGLEDDLSFSTACGLVLRGAGAEKESSFGGDSLAAFKGKFGNAIKKIFRSFSL
ncbi:MAG: cell division protein FtsA [bacterium]|nr:cell division protein FtsA [bacterium]